MSQPLDDARRALDFARLALRRSFYPETVSRAYYAAFYSAREAVRLRGSPAHSHSGVASEFSRLYVQTGEVPTDIARELRRLAAKRDGADYKSLDISADDAAEALDAAERFVAAVSTLLGVPPPPLLTVGLTDNQKRDLVAQLTREMDAAAMNLEFEKAAELRDSIAQIEADLAA